MNGTTGHRSMRDFPSEFSRAIITIRATKPLIPPRFSTSPFFFFFFFSLLFSSFRIITIESDALSNRPCQREILEWMESTITVRKILYRLNARLSLEVKQQRPLHEYFFRGVEGKRPRPALVRTWAEDNFGVAAQIDRATRSHSFELRSNSAGDFSIVATNWYTPWPPARATPTCTSVHAFCK